MCNGNAPIRTLISYRLRVSTHILRSHTQLYQQHQQNPEKLFVILLVVVGAIFTHDWLFFDNIIGVGVCTYVKLFSFHYTFCLHVKFKYLGKHINTHTHRGLAESAEFTESLSLFIYYLVLNSFYFYLILIGYLNCREQAEFG